MHQMFSKPSVVIYFKVVEKKAKDLIYTKTFLTPEICLSVKRFRNQNLGICWT